MGTGTFRASQDGAQIVGVGQLVADDDEGGLVPGGGFFQNVVDGHIFMGSGQSDDALVGTGGGHGIQLPPVNGHYHGSRLLGLGGQPLKALVRIALGHEHLVDGAAAFQCLRDGVPAFQLTFCFLLRLGTLGKQIGPAGGILPSLGTAFFIHKGISLHKLLIGIDTGIIAVIPHFLKNYFLKTRGNPGFAPAIHRKFTIPIRILHCLRGKFVI